MALSLLRMTDTTLTYLDTEYVARRPASSFSPTASERPGYYYNSRERPLANQTDVNLLDKMCRSVFQRHIGKLIIQVRKVGGGPVGQS